MLRPAPAAAPVHYPSSDGKPMAENDAQRDAIMYGIGALARHFRDRPDVYVSGDLLIYYEAGNPASVDRAGRLRAVFGVEDRRRQTCKSEGRRTGAGLRAGSGLAGAPCGDDLGRKRPVHARLGERADWQYDLLGEHLPARLQGGPAGGNPLRTSTPRRRRRAAR